MRRGFEMIGSDPARDQRHRRQVAAVPDGKLAAVVVADRRDLPGFAQRRALGVAQSRGDHAIAPPLNQRSRLRAAGEEKFFRPRPGEKKNHWRMDSSDGWPKEGVT